MTILIACMGWHVASTGLEGCLRKPTRVIWYSIDRCHCYCVFFVIPSAIQLCGGTCLVSQNTIQTRVHMATTVP